MEGVHKEYIRKFLKIKLETSEFTCSEEEYRRKARKFDIKLGELKRNPGMRFIAKICLIRCGVNLAKIQK